jgi:hypothetical protein
VTKQPSNPARQGVPCAASEDVDADVLPAEPDWPVSLIGKAGLTAALLGVTGMDLYVLAHLV